MTKKLDRDMKIDNYKEIKAILIGETGVGKTNLINTSLGMPFDSKEKTTVTSNFVQLKFKIDNNKFKIDLWDTAGQEKFRGTTKLFFKSSRIVIFVYDITNKRSFEELDNYWIKEVEEHLGDKAVYGIVGNKKDLDKEKEISEETVKQFADSKKMAFKLVSAKEDPKLFRDFLGELLKKKILLYEEKEKQTLKINRKLIMPEESSSCGCSK